MITNDLVKIACEYYKQGNSLKETAELLDKKHNFKIYLNTLGYHLKKSGLKLRIKIKAIVLRKRKHINISRLLENYNNKVPIRELSRSLKIGRGTIRKVLKENKISIRDSRSSLIAMDYIKEKQKVSLSDKEKAYLYGLVMGDLTPVRRSNYTLKLITHSTHLTFIELLYNIFNKYGRSSYKETKLNGMFRFQTHIDLDSFSFLLYSKSEIIPDWINSDNFFDFLAGFIDSDGSVMLKRAGKNVFYSIRFFGQNLDLLSEIKNRLKDLGYDSPIHLSHKKGYTHYRNGIMFRYNKDYYILETRKGLQTIKLLNQIPIRHPEKILKRELIFKIYKENINQWNQIEQEVNRVRLLIKQSVLSDKS